MKEAEPVTDALRNAGERARTGLEQAQRKSRDVIAATREKGEALIEDTREKGYRAAAETNRLFQEHPIAAVAAAAAAGAVLAIFLPRLAIAEKAGKLAGKAVKAAIASETPRKLWSSVREAGKHPAAPDNDVEG
jgi:ElaB/YqjD/DUF883 family membrane-anchored ribosome-binding protein